VAQDHVQPKFSYTTGHLTDWVSYVETQDKSAPAEIFEQQGCWSTPKTRLICVKNLDGDLGSSTKQKKRYKACLWGIFHSTSWPKMSFSYSLLIAYSISAE